MMLRLMRGDCLKMMQRIEAGSVDLILCDLPYGTTRNKWDTVIPMAELWAEYRRVLCPHGVVVLSASQPFSSMLVMSNPKWFKYEWVWEKSRITNVLNAKHAPVRKHEQVLVFAPSVGTFNRQGIEKVENPTRRGQSSSSSSYGVRGRNGYVQEETSVPRDIIFVPSERGGLHPAQKPVSLMEYMVNTYSNEGDVVLDNCMGSGTTGVACKRLGRSFIGIELDRAYFEIAKKRIHETKKVK